MLRYSAKCCQLIDSLSELDPVLSLAEQHRDFRRNAARDTAEAVDERFLHGAHHDDGRGDAVHRLVCHRIVRHDPITKYDGSGASESIKGELDDTSPIYPLFGADSLKESFRRVDGVLGDIDASCGVQGWIDGQRHIRPGLFFSAEQSSCCKIGHVLGSDRGYCSCNLGMRRLDEYQYGANCPRLRTVRALLLIGNNLARIATQQPPSVVVEDTAGLHAAHACQYRTGSNRIFGQVQWQATTT